jgi:hypothetical protein
MTYVVFYERETDGCDQTASAGEQTSIIFCARRDCATFAQNTRTVGGAAKMRVLVAIGERTNIKKCSGGAKDSRRTVDRACS